MSQIDQSFDALRVALLSLYPAQAQGKCEVRKTERTLLLQLPTDIAAFSVYDGNAQEDFNCAYNEFKGLYRANHGEWDRRTLSFVLCRSVEHSEDDRFYATLENDPLFCRKYVIQAYNDVLNQRRELLRLPFLPLPDDGQNGLLRPRSAQDLLQTAGVSASLARKLIEGGHRSADGIADDLQLGSELIPERLGEPGSLPLTLSTPRAYSRLTSASLEKFRAYRKLQSFDLDAPVVVLYGPNGLGKTSFFDAIDYACTGRIGRLCRQQTRTQSDFSRMATHLDETPGTGSVVLHGRSERGPGAAPADFILKRATGDWSNAWIDGNKQDRKGVLSFLTSADWADSRPRQQNFESLFRATHLFGQDEQELLVEFRKGSIIPEEFISEMLALQDYSQGLTKIKALQGALSTRKADLEKRLRQLLDEFAALSESLPTVSSEQPDVSPLTPIDETIASLRMQLSDANLIESQPPDNLTISTGEEWREVVSAQLQTIETRATLASVLREELPAHRRLREEIASTQAKLAEVEKEIQALNDQGHEVAGRTEVTTNFLQERELRRKQLEDRRRELRTVLEARTKAIDLKRRVEQLKLELQAAELELSAVNVRVSATEQEIATTTASQTDRLKALAALRVESADLATLIAGFPQFDMDTAALTVMNSRLTLDEAALGEAEQQNAVAKNESLKAKLDRESLLPEYERALAQQAELDKLLDSIQSHVHDSSCPLCGTAFDSLQSLLDTIARQRSQVASEPEVTHRYKSLVSLEAQASDKLRRSLAQLTAAKTAVADGDRLRDELAAKVASFRERAIALLVDPAADVSEAVFSARLDAIARQLRELELASESHTSLTQQLQDSRTTDQTHRALLIDRKTQLEREIENGTDENTQSEARTRQVLQREGVAADEIDPAIAQVTADLDALVAANEQLVQQIAKDTASFNETRTKTQEALSRRSAMLGTLKRLLTSISEARSSVVALGLTEDAQKAEFDEIIALMESQGTTLRHTLERSREIIDLLRAREIRLQLAEKREQLTKLKAQIDELEAQVAKAQKSTKGCTAIDKLLGAERQTSIEKHIAAYGPLITNIQQRLRSVYGFGSVQLKARGGEAAVEVEWRNKSVQVPPTDFFSDSQKQILMLSIFLAGGLRQNWSGFAPVLLDDPVTHFDDLNAYGFVELIRGIVTSEPHAFQFIISTCEDRLFSLMKKKFTRVEGGAIFYEYLGMSADGPIVERHHGD